MSSGEQKIQGPGIKPHAKIWIPLSTEVPFMEKQHMQALKMCMIHFFLLDLFHHLSKSCYAL